MKIGIIGTGLVGSITAYSLATAGIAREIILIDTNKNKALAEALDILHATPYAYPCRIQAGEYADLENADIVIIAAGVAQIAGENRLALLERNIEIFRGIIHNIIRYAADSLILVASNPVDLLTAFTQKEARLPTGRIIGSGTVLDTARFRTILGAHLNLAPQSVHAYVLGEHGDSEVLVWSAAQAGNMPLDAYAAEAGIPLNTEIKNHIDSEVRNAAYKIIAGKSATYYGIAASITRICKAVFYDENAVLTVSTHHSEIEGIKDICMSMPTVINRSGVRQVLYPELSASEHLLLKQSAQKIHDYIHK
ncbi:MAG: L-lactate dehydrogenase [Pseudomonadota bacterium]|nr:L-lactate dehydrogenase [Pseudomonadota bacterium]